MAKLNSITIPHRKLLRRSLPWIHIIAAQRWHKPKSQRLPPKITNIIRDKDFGRVCLREAGTPHGQRLLETGPKSDYSLATCHDGQNVIVPHWSTSRRINRLLTGTSKTLGKTGGRHRPIQSLCALGTISGDMPEGSFIFGKPANNKSNQCHQKHAKRYIKCFNWPPRTILRARGLLLPQRKRNESVRNRTLPHSCAGTDFRVEAERPVGKGWSDCEDGRERVGAERCGLIGIQAWSIAEVAEKCEWVDRFHERPQRVMNIDVIW